MMRERGRVCVCTVCERERERERKERRQTLLGDTWDPTTESSPLLNTSDLN